MSIAMITVAIEKIRTETYVSYQHTPNLFLVEHSTKQVFGLRDPYAQIDHIPRLVHAFYFYDEIVAVITIDGRDIETRSKPQNKSAIYYVKELLSDQQDARYEALSTEIQTV